jgi:predicted enzyme related to lactoylglutathione lyase
MDLRFDCFFYHVSDMERSIRFYRDLLGLQLTSRDVVGRFEIDGVLFELVPGSPHRGGGGKLCLKTADLSRTAEELRELGVAVTDTRTVENGMLAYIQDPDGNEICLWQYRSE